MDLEIIAMKGYSTFPRALGLKPHHQIQFSVISWTFVAGVRIITLCRDANGVFYSFNQLDYYSECEPDNSIAV